MIVFIPHDLLMTKTLATFMTNLIKIAILFLFEIELLVAKHHYQWYLSGSSSLKQRK